MEPPVCPKCQEGCVLLGEPTGHILDDFQGAYYAPGATGEGDTAGHSKSAVLLLTDAFGLSLKNCKIIADELAKRVGCDVWIPDYFAGKPLFPADDMTLPDRAGAKVSIWAWIRLFVTVFIPRIPAVIGSRPSVVDNRMNSFINLIKEKKGYQKIGAVGYCFGGPVSVRFAATGLLDSIVVAHPAKFSVEQLNAIKVPSSWIWAEDDLFFPKTLRDQCESELAGRKGKENFTEYEFKEYKGTAHGFASRPNLEVPEVKEGFEGALDQTVGCFKKTLLH